MGEKNSPNVFLFRQKNGKFIINNKISIKMKKKKQKIAVKAAFWIIVTIRAIIKEKKIQYI